MMNVKNRQHALLYILFYGDRFEFHTGQRRKDVGNLMGANKNSASPRKVWPVWVPDGRYGNCVLFVFYACVVLCVCMYACGGGGGCGGDDMCVYLRVWWWCVLYTRKKLIKYQKITK